MVEHASTSVIEVTDLSKTFDSVRAVDEVSFTVNAGSVFGFLGPNGAGKTTTIRLLLGLIAPSAGSAKVFGFDAVTSGRAIRQRTGALLEHHGLYERLTAEDNLSYHARIRGLAKHERTARIDELLTHFGLTEHRRKPSGALSRGMKQKLAIARVLLHHPSLIFLDEPTAGLDPVATSSLRDDIARLAGDEGVTIFMTTHNLAEAERLCDTVAVMNKGRIISHGSPSSLRSTDSGARYVMTGSTFPDACVEICLAQPGVTAAEYVDSALRLTLSDGVGPTPVLSALLERGTVIDEVRREQESLEDIFLKLLEESDDA